jgi:hypothetical protein
VATKKTTNFSPSVVGFVGRGIRDPVWIKIRIRDKYPGSATMGTVPGTFLTYYIHMMIWH